MVRYDEGKVGYLYIGKRFATPCTLCDTDIDWGTIRLSMKDVQQRPVDTILLCVPPLQYVVCYGGACKVTGAEIIFSLAVQNILVDAVVECRIHYSLSSNRSRTMRAEFDTRIPDGFNSAESVGGRWQMADGRRLGLGGTSRSVASSPRIMWKDC